MVFFTNTYRLTAFQDGDPFSASSDQNRMKIIDQHLELISSLVGEGRLYGWQIQDESSSSEFIFKISPGAGFIDKFASYSYGDIEFTLSDNTENCIYLQRKNGVVGGVSGLSSSSSVTYSDLAVTSDVTNVTITTFDYNFITLDWDYNPEPDISHYVVERSPDNIAWTEVAQTSTNTYTDSTVSDDTIYYYRVKAVDINGNESASYTVSSPAFVKTSKDLSAPANPEFILNFPQDSQVELVWSAPNSGGVDSYEVDYVRVDSEYNEIGSFSTVSTTDEKIVIDSLSNEFVYKFVIYSVSEHSIRSEGISVFASPNEQTGPSEVSSMTITDISSANNDTGVAISISWSELPDAYLTPSSTYEITIIENGSVTSQPIVSTSTSKVIEVFVGEDGLSRSIKPRLDYTILVKGVDSNGVKNNGSVGTITTRNFRPPNDPTNVELIENNDGDILITWDNSSSVFSYNEIILTSDDGTTTTVIESSTNYGKTNSYIIDFDSTTLSTTYTMKVKAVDEFGNESNYSQDSITTISSDDIETNPVVPSIAAVFSNDRLVTLIINKATSKYAESYKVWRAPFSNSLIPPDFTLVATIPATSDKFDDYSVENDQGYYYFLTTVDRFGNESLSPDNNFISYNLFRAYPHANISFESPGSISVVSSGYDATISWTPSSDSFEGYEILRSKGDVFNYEVVGSVVKELGFFVDEDALLEDGETYFYAIRKYRNEVKVITSDSCSAPSTSILLGKINISNGNVSIEDLAEDRTGLQFEALGNVSDRIDNHKHILTDNNDLRIDLNEYATIDNWTSTNNLVYTTDVDISSATNFVVRVAGALPSVFYFIDADTSTLTFSSAVAGGVTVEAIGINEIQNQIQKERVDNVFASQVESGTILKNQFDTYNHGGRIEEDVKPLQFKMSTKDSYKYTIAQNDFVEQQEAVASGITFYDMISFGNLSFLSWALLLYGEWNYFIYEEWFYLELGEVAGLAAATSQGLQASFDRGLTWSSLRQTDYAAHKLYYAEMSDAYFALSGNDVYYSKNGISWVKMNGLENSSFCKDVAEDDLGNVYLTTDLGVFKLDQSGLGDQLVWEHAAFASAESSDCYGIWYDDINSELFLSNEIGLFKSYDRGLSWESSNDIDEYGVIHQFHEENLEYADYVFVVQDHYLWRKNILDSSFEKIAYVEHELRKVDVYNNRIILTSSDGFLISKSQYDPWVDIDIDFERLELLDINKNRVESTLLKEVVGLLFLGTDGILKWTVDFVTARDSYEDLTSVKPSAYVNGEKKRIGTYYGPSEMFFDKPQKYEDNISIANQYVGFYVDNKGWVDQNYLAPIRMSKNNEVIAELESTSFNFPSTEFNNVTFETFTNSTYNVDLANLYKSNYESELARAISIQSGSTDLLEEGESLQSISADIVRYYYKTYANKFGRVKFYSTITIDSSIYAVVDNEIVLSSVLSEVYPEYDFVLFIDPYITQFQDLVQIDSMNGIFGFLAEYTKYDEVKIDIYNAYLYNSGVRTHQELEDIFELNNIGLPSVLGNISSVNLIKQGLFIEKNFGKAHSTPIDDCEQALPRQATYKISDSQNWYDVLNSTIDYSEETSSSNLNTSISYPIAVEYVSGASQVWVGGPEGLMSIDKDTDDLAIIDFNDGKVPEEVRDIFISENQVYIVTPQNVYLTNDYGLTWNSVYTGGASGLFNKISKVKNNLVLFTDSGIYYKNNAFREWQVSSGTITSINFVNNPDLLFAFDENQMYTSSSGTSWNTRTDFDIDVNAITKYRGIFLAATSIGLGSDGATFYGNTSTVSTMDIASDISISQSLYMNDVAADSDNQIILAGQNNGDYWLFSSGSWVQNTDSYLDTIHKVLLVDQQPWLFGFDMFKSPNSSTPMRLVESSPL